MENKIIQATLSPLALASEKVNNWDMKKLTKYVLKEHPELADRIDNLLAEYKNYLVLCALTDTPLSVPSHDVDKVWHCHLCLNADYNKMTQEIMGKILIHTPFLEGDTTDPSAKQNLIDASFLYFGKFVFNAELLSYAGCNNCDGNGCLNCHNGCK